MCTVEEVVGVVPLSCNNCGAGSGVADRQNLCAESVPVPSEKVGVAVGWVLVEENVHDPIFWLEVCHQFRP